MARGIGIEVVGASRSFGRGAARQLAVDRVGFSIAPGEMVALLGPSGAGKSTLLRLIAGLLPGEPGSGAIAVGGEVVQRGGRIAPGVRCCRARVGMIFQQFNLVGRLSVETNVLCGALHRQPAWRTLGVGFPRAERKEAMACLARVGMDAYAGRRANQLSGGQQQRVAIARTLLQRAGAILGDEPIASLDPESARVVMDTLAEINRRDGATVLVSLHQVEHARRSCARAIAMRAGRVVYDGPTAGLDDRRLDLIYGRTPPPPPAAPDERDLLVARAGAPAVPSPSSTPTPAGSP